MEYPKDFPPESRAAVAAEKLRAARDFDQMLEDLRRSADIGEQVRKYILRQFLVFVREASKLGKRGIWHVDHLQNAAMEFLRRATIDAVYDKGGGRLHGEWVSHFDGSLNSEIKRHFEKSSEWRQYEDMLLQVAEAQEAGAAQGDAEGLTESGRKRGYRAEVRQWMLRQKVEKVSEAASRLGISESTLKSIMSARGERRYSAQTLDRILGIIGVTHP
jgi:Uri superfamily endonuclease